MTTLVAYQGDGFAVIGCDSRATEDDGFFMDLATPKVVKNGPYLVAVSGASRGGNIAQFGWVPPKPPHTDDLTRLDKFVTSKLIPSLRRAFINAGYDAKDDGESATQDSNLILIFNGFIYQINEDYSWDREIRNLYFSGSGGQIACGAMAALEANKNDSPNEIKLKIEKAIDYACQWSAFSSPPVLTFVQYGIK